MTSRPYGLVFEGVVPAVDTPAYFADTDKATAEFLWMTKLDHILETYYLRADQGEPG